MELKEFESTGISFSHYNKNVTNTEKTIQFNSGVFEITLTESQVKKIWEDNLFLQDSIIAILDPKSVNEGWDFYLTAKEYKKKLVKFFIKETLYSNDFIKKVFAPKSIKP